MSFVFAALSVKRKYVDDVFRFPDRQLIAKLNLTQITPRSLTRAR